MFCGFHLHLPSSSPISPISPPLCLVQFLYLLFVILVLFFFVSGVLSPLVTFALFNDLFSRFLFPGERSNGKAEAQDRILLWWVSREVQNHGLRRQGQRHLFYLWRWWLKLCNAAVVPIHGIAFSLCQSSMQFPGGTSSKPTMWPTWGSGWPP